MTTPPAISVVVPYYDSEKYIEHCLASLHEQRGVEGGFELLFVDNGSSDGSPEIVARYDGVTHLSESKEGAYAARNAGIAQARGRVIAFTDADCRVDSDWLANAQRALQDESVGIAIGHCRYPQNGTPGLKVLGRYENAKASYVAQRGNPRQQFAYGNNMVVRADVFEAIGPFREWKRAADSELVHRMAAEAAQWRLIFCKQMRITHLEFTRAKARARRLRLYAQTNTKIGSFEELTTTQRVRILLRALWL
ncbi:MAG: glycosyltransferase [Acidobacteriota bacterium]